MLVFFPSSQTTKVDVTNGTRASLSQPTHRSRPCTRERCSTQSLRLADEATGWNETPHG